MVLIQDRPVLGEWFQRNKVVDAWSNFSMGNNNRWAREGGVIDEIMVENTFRNPEGNLIILILSCLTRW